MKVKESPKTVQERLRDCDQIEAGPAKEKEAKRILSLAEFKPTQLPKQRTSRISIALTSILQGIDDFLYPTPAGAISEAEGRLQRLRTKKRFEEAGLLPKR